MTAPPPETLRPGFGEAVRFWLKLGFISFGGPAGQIAILHQELVERRRWISEPRFLHALNFCTLLPGPEAQQLATYIGWLLHGTRGGVAAGALFVLPSAVILWGLSWAYVTLGALPWVAGLLWGLKPAVLAIVAAAAVRLGGRVLRRPFAVAMAALAFLSLAVFAAPFPAVVLGAGVVGWLAGRWRPQVAAEDPRDSLSTVGTGEESPRNTRKDTKRGLRLSCAFVFFVDPNGVFRQSLKVLGLWGALWWMPLLAVGAVAGWGGTLFQQGLFFSKAAMVTFGGAYAVLPYVSQQAVERYGWLEVGQMVDGLALAETTPGPLIMVLQFVGFVGAWQHPGGLPPLLAATLGAAVTTWATFAPCFLWIFLGAPHLERWRTHRGLNDALSAITAAVLGVLCNLWMWFAWKVLWMSEGGLDWFAAGVAILGCWALVRWKMSTVTIVLAGALAGLARTLCG